MSPTELIIVLTAVIVGAIVKSVTGMGLPLIAVPIAALFVDLQDAIVVIALPNVLANFIIGAREWDSRHETRDLPTLAIAGMCGAVLGTFALVNVSETLLIGMLIVAILVYVTMFVLNPTLQLSAEKSRRWSAPVGAVAGAFQGAIGISGPIVGSWILSYRLPRSAHILSVTTLFFLTGATQLTILIAAGELSGRTTATLLACIPVLASIPIGAALRDRISAKGFDRAILGLLLGSAVALCLRVVA